MDGPTAFESAAHLMERYVKGGGDLADRDRAIDLFDAAIATGSLAADDEVKARAGIGMLLALRIFPLPFGPQPSTPDIQMFLGLMAGGLSLDSAQTRSDLARAREHLRHVASTAPGTEAADHVVGLLAILDLFAVAPDPASAGPEAAPGVRDVLDGAIEEMTPSPRRDLMAGLRSVLLLDTPAGADLDRNPATLVTALETILDALPPDAAVRPTLLGDTALLLAHFGVDGDPAVTMADAPRLLEEALATVGTDDPLRADLERRLAGVLVAWSAGTADPEAIDRVVASAETMLAGDPSGTDADPVVRGRDHFLRAMALALRSRRDTNPDDLRAAVSDLGRAMESVPTSDPLTPAIAATYAAILHDRSLADGVFEDADAARYHLEQARAVLQARAIGGADADRVEALALIPRAITAIRRRDTDTLAPLIDDLDAAARRFPEYSSWRARLTGILGLARLAHGMTRREIGLIRAGLDDMTTAAAATGVDVAGRSALTALGAVATFLGGLLDNDPARIAAGSEQLSDPAVLTGLGHMERVGVSTAGGLSRLARFDTTADPAELDAAIAQLTTAADQLAEDDGNPFAPQVLHLLAGAHARRADDTAGDRAADRDRSVDLGLAGLRAHTASALLQSTPAHALQAVTAAAEDARRVATWCLDAGRPTDAVTAIELGRGLVLHATVSAGRVPAMLREAGHPDLADEWEATGADLEPVRWNLSDGIGVLGPFLDGTAPNDLRRRVLSALRATPAIRDLLTSPAPAEIAEALLRTGRDALVYLLPADGSQPGRLLAVDAAARVVDIPAPGLCVTDDGPVAAFLHADLRADDGNRVGTAGQRLRELDTPGSVRPERWTQILADVCDWAYPAVIAPLLTAPGDRPRSVVFVPTGALGRVPWHAARRSGATTNEYACTDLLLSSAASARQLVDASARAAAPGGGAAVLVADPTGGLPGATAEVEALRDTIYTDAVVLGTASGAAGPGTPAEVLDSLRDAGLVHLACHASTGAGSDTSFLRLGERLLVADVLRRARHRTTDRRMVLVLSACTSDVSADAHDEALTLATAFLAAGATTVVGSLWAVPDDITPVLMYVFHHHLTVLRRPAAEALRAAQLWMLDPDREPPPGMPADLRRTAHTNDLTAIDAWAAFAHHGA
jgi:hypothetical protein